MRKVSRLLSVALSLVLCLGMAAPAFAAEGVDAYYYVEVQKEQINLVESRGPGTGTNDGWAFMGKGTVTEEIAAQAPIRDQAEDEKAENPDAKELDNGGKLPEGYTAPKAGEEQTFENGLYYDWSAADGEQEGDKVTRVTVTAFHNIGQYQYDDESDPNGSVAQYTYTVIWETVENCTNSDAEYRGGYNFNGSEISVKGGGSLSDTPEAGNICFAGPAIHVNGTATLHQNNSIKVVIQGYGQETGDSINGQGYVRDTEDKDGQVVQGALSGLVAGREDKDLLEDETYYEAKTELVGNEITKTYTEREVEVEYKVNRVEELPESVQAVIEQALAEIEAGKTGAVKGVTNLAEMLENVETEDGVYRFDQNWKINRNDDGSFSITTNYTFEEAVQNLPPQVIEQIFPEYYDFGLTEIEDEEVPLAGLFTRADAIGYLWEQAGRPEAELSTFEDVPADHVWAEAIGWAQDAGIAVADQEGNFRPDDLVLRWVEDLEAEPEGELQEFLNRYAQYAGVKLDAGELFVELGGEPEDIVMGEDAQVIFDSFFAKLEEALEDQAA